MAVVRNAVGLWASAGVGFGPLRIGTVVPAWLATSDRYEGARLSAGDIRVDVHFVPFRAEGRRPGFGLLVRGWVPLGATRLGLGAAGGAWEAVALVDGRVGPVELGGELGFRALPRVVLGDVLSDDGVVYRVSAAARVSARGGVALELAGRVGVTTPPSVETAPLEAVLSGWVVLSDDVRLRLGAGTALVRGVDAAPVRVLFGVHARAPRTAPPRTSPVR